MTRCVKKQTLGPPRVLLLHDRAAPRRVPPARDTRADGARRALAAAAPQGRPAQCACGARAQARVDAAAAGHAHRAPSSNVPARADHTGRGDLDVAGVWHRLVRVSLGLLHTILHSTHLFIITLFFFVLRNSLFFEVYPVVFFQQHHFAFELTGLPFLAMVIGFFFAAWFYVPLVKYFMRMPVPAFIQPKGSAPDSPESRLKLALFAWYVNLTFFLLLC